MENVRDFSLRPERDSNSTPQLLCLWSGPLMLLLFWFGFMYCAGYLPPPSADLAPAQLVLRIQNNLAVFRIGMLVTMIGFSLMVPWAAGIAALVRSSDGRYPVLSHTLWAALDRTGV